MGEKLCNPCAGGDCLFKQQLSDLYERRGSRYIPPCKPGMDPESSSADQKQQQRIIGDARFKNCPFEARERVKALEKIKDL